MKFFRIYKFACVLFVLILGEHAVSQTSQQGIPTQKIDEDYPEKFLRYEPYVNVVPESKREIPKPPEKIAPLVSDKKNKNEVVDADWLIKNYKLIEKRAFDNPTKENAQALAYIKRLIFDKSQRFEEAVSKVVREDPYLNENNRIPYASSGSASIRRANMLAQREALRELSKIGGLIVFTDGQCRFCSMQIPVLEMLKNEYGLESLVISLDGKRPEGYKGVLTKDNGLYKRLDLRLVPSLVYVAHPKAYRESDPNRYLIISQGYNVEDELTTLIAYAGFSENLLSAKTREDLSVWQRGVATSDDLKDLRLDANDPLSIKRNVEPLLKRQYR